MDGPAGEHGLDRLAELAFGLFAHGADDAGDQVFNERLLPEDFGAAQAAAGKKGFERLDEPALGFGFQIPFDGLRPGVGAQTRLSGRLLEIEERAKAFGFSGVRGEAS